MREFFRRRGKGYFVEVGANDPKTESQSWHLEQSGWTGILVEPLPDLAARLAEAAHGQGVTKSPAPRPSAPAARMTLHVAGAVLVVQSEICRSPACGRRASIDVPVRTLDSLLDEAEAPKPIDLLSVDVEGHELDVLRGFDFARWKPRLILLEDHVTSLDKHTSCQRAGYRLIRRTGLNGWYAPRDDAPPLDWQGRWQIFRKYYLALPFRILREFKRRMRDRIRLGNGGDARCPSSPPS